MSPRKKSENNAPAQQMVDEDLILLCELAQDIYRQLGSGHDENIYQKAMEVGLRSKGIEYDAQRKIELTYLDHFVGIGIPDLIVRFKTKNVVVELKVGQAMGYGEEQQLRNYLKILRIPTGLLINFQCAGQNLSFDKVELQKRQVDHKEPQQSPAVVS